VPSTSECIIVRVRTSGVLEEELVIDKLRFKIFDVGGQRAERRKWITCFVRFLLGFILQRANDARRRRLGPSYGGGVGERHL